MQNIIAYTISINCLPLLLQTHKLKL